MGRLALDRDHCQTAEQEAGPAVQIVLIQLNHVRDGGEHDDTKNETSRGGKNRGASV